MHVVIEGGVSRGWREAAARAPAVATAGPRAAGRWPALDLPPGWSQRPGEGYALYADAESDEHLGFAFATARGLEGRPRGLEFRWLYDDRGSHIFERITEQAEYYQTRTENGILLAAADQIRERVGAATLVELGSGSSTKTRRLLDAFCRRGPSRYLPIDVSVGALGPACQALGAAYDNLTVEGIAAPYQRGLPLLGTLSPLCLVFLGSSIGNFDQAECDRFLDDVAASLRPGDHFLVGLDTVKDPRRLEAAYNDAAGWSAAFTRNLFARMNRELGTAFDLEAIEHVAWYDERCEQVEIHARFARGVAVDLPAVGRSFRIGAGEMVRTEISRKFRPAEFCARAARFGFEPVDVHTDAEGLFAVVLLRRCGQPLGARPRDPRQALAATLAAVRHRTLEIVAPLGDEDLRRQYSPLMSPLLWDLAHIGAYEQLWLCGQAGALPAEAGAAVAPMPTPPGGRGEGLPAELDALRNPRPTRGALPLPDRAEVLARLRDTRAAALAALARPAELAATHPHLVAMVAQHEAQHQETMLAALQLRGDLPYRPAFIEPAPPRHADLRLDEESILVPAGAFTMGTDDRAEAFDNERPRHQVLLPAFRIDAAPVTNAAWLRFIEDGGYRRPELWTEAGWAWRTAADATAPGHWERDGDRLIVRIFGERWPIDPDCPVVHVSWYEADAYARWAGRRLPSEAEWEKAAVWDAETGRARRYPWGEEPPTAERANLGQRQPGPSPIGSHGSGRSFYGCHQMLGDVWEWTSSWFAPYPGFVAYPYPEYSQVFFDDRYRVLRGGSFATLPLAARGTFRNWDFPERRQIFSGLRCCRDA